MEVYIWFIIVIQICFGFADYTNDPYSADELCKNNNNHATIDLGMMGQSAVILKSTTSDTYTTRGNCQIDIRPTDGYGVVSYVNIINLRTSPTSKCKDYVVIKGTNSSGALCYNAGDVRISSLTSGTLTIDFYTEQDTVSISNENYPFEIVLTQYSNCKSKTEFGDFGEFRCSNGLCVWKNLECDNQNNCGDKSDEPYFTCKVKKPLFLALYIGGGLAGLLLIWFIVRCCSKRNNSVTRRDPDYGSREITVVRRSVTIQGVAIY